MASSNKTLFYFCSYKKKHGKKKILFIQKDDFNFDHNHDALSGHTS